MKFRNIRINNLLPKIKALFPPANAQQRPRDRSVLLLPSLLFFSQRVSIPEGLTEEDYDSFAEITLEDLAPFPIESLAWGYATNGNVLLLYATPKERLKAYDHLDTAFHVFPAFLSLKDHPVSTPSIAFLRFGNTLSAVSLTPQQSLPTPLRGIHLDEDATDEAFFEARGALAKHYAQEAVELCEGIVSIEDATALLDGSIVFHLSKQESPEAPIQELQPHILEGNESLWRADIRDAMAKYAFKKSRELGKRLWLSLKIAAGTGAVILTLDIISAVSDWVVSSRENTIASQTPEVTRVENNQQLLDKLNQFYNQELKPFELLDILNEVRPRSIYFTDVISQNFNDIEVRGMASNVEEVNAYTSTLDEAPEVISVELIDILTRQGQVNFTLKAKIDINPPETLPALDDPGKQFEEDAEMSPTEVEQLKESASPENNQPETNL